MFQLKKRSAILALCLAAASFGYAKKGGNGNGGNKGGGKPTDSGTTFVVGQVVSTDSKILDVSGDYTLTGTSHTVSLSLTQDDRGRLVTTATVTLADGSTTEIKLTGHLQLTAQKNLRIQLNGGNDSATSAVSVHIKGPYDGTAFQVSVKVNDYSGNETFNATITPVNTARGFTIEDAVSTVQGKGYRSTRTVTLPWGTVTGAAKQDNGKKDVKFSIHTSTFGIDLRGTVSGNTFSITRNQVKTGYGELRSAASTTTVSPSTLTAP